MYDFCTETKMEQTFAMTIIISYMVCRSNNIFFSKRLGTYRRSNLTKIILLMSIRLEMNFLSFQLNCYIFIFFSCKIASLCCLWVVLFYDSGISPSSKLDFNVAHPFFLTSGANYVPLCLLLLNAVLLPLLIGFAARLPLFLIIWKESVVVQRNIYSGPRVQLNWWSVSRCCCIAVSPVCLSVSYQGLYTLFCLLLTFDIDSLQLLIHFFFVLDWHEYGLWKLLCLMLDRCAATGYY